MLCCELIYTAISRKVVEKNVYATIPKGNMGSDQYTVPDDCSCRTYFCCFLLALANTFPCPFVPILSNFFEKRRTQNHPQCLSGLSRALFPTTFLEIAIYTIQRNTFQFQRMLQFWFPENICRGFKLNQLESRTTGTTCVLGLLLMKKLLYLAICRSNNYSE